MQQVDPSPILDLELRSRSFLTKIAIFSLLNKIFKSGLLQESFAKGTCNDIKKCDHEIKVQDQIKNENRKI
jgi:hypothetical protein